MSNKETNFALAPTHTGYSGAKRKKQMNNNEKAIATIAPELTKAANRATNICI